ncbi:hypothetical protein MMC28_002145 [Mycoblastus sanguinarius]|nr:hypothetical protein [Mycoblastus sanguinarius]
MSELPPNDFNEALRSALASDIEEPHCPKPKDDSPKVHQESCASNPSHECGTPLHQDHFNSPLLSGLTSDVEEPQNIKLPVSTPLSNLEKHKEVVKDMVKDIKEREKEIENLELLPPPESPTQEPILSRDDQNRDKIPSLNSRDLKPDSSPSTMKESSPGPIQELLPRLDEQVNGKTELDRAEEVQDTAGSDDEKIGTPPRDCQNMDKPPSTVSVDPKPDNGPSFVGEHPPKPVTESPQPPFGPANAKNDLDSVQESSPQTAMGSPRPFGPVHAERDNDGAQESSSQPAMGPLPRPSGPVSAERDLDSVQEASTTTSTDDKRIITPPTHPTAPSSSTAPRVAPPSSENSNSVHAMHEDAARDLPCVHQVLAPRSAQDGPITVSRPPPGVSEADFAEMMMLIEVIKSSRTVKALESGIKKLDLLKEIIDNELRRRGLWDGKTRPSYMFPGCGSGFRKT